MLSTRIQGKVTLTSEELDEASASYKSAGIVTKVCGDIKPFSSVVFSSCNHYPFNLLYAGTE